MWVRVIRIVWDHFYDGAPCWVTGMQTIVHRPPGPLCHGRVSGHHGSSIHGHGHPLNKPLSGHRLKDMKKKKKTNNSNDIVHHVRQRSSASPWGSPCSCWAGAAAGGSCWWGSRCPCRPAPWAGAGRRPTARPAAAGASCGCSSEVGTNQTWLLCRGEKQDDGSALCAGRATVQVQFKRKK